MAGYTTPPARRELLNLLVGKPPAWAGPEATARPTYIGLASAVPLDSTPTLATISEVVVGGYARKVVGWRDAVISGNVVKVTNSDAVTLGPVTEDMQPVPYAFLADIAAGSEGTLLYVWELAEPVGALTNKPLYVPADQLIIE